MTQHPHAPGRARNFAFYICRECGFVKTATEKKHSHVGNYCPMCHINQIWSGPFNTKTHRPTGKPTRPANQG